MRVVALLILLFGLAGCTPDLRPLSPVPTVEELMQLPRQWEVPTLYVRLPEEMSANDYRIELAKKLCQEFAIRLYDAFDGQAYVHRFVICNPSLVPERQAGMMNLFENGTIILYHNETYAGDPPFHPGYSYIEMPHSADYIPHRAGTMLHEWLHAYVGLGDEYKHRNEPGNQPTTSCPLHPQSSKAIDEHACVMNDSSRRELCRPSNHNPDTDQGKTDCYTYAAIMLAKARIALIIVPDHRIEGPTNPPTPVIEVRLK